MVKAITNKAQLNQLNGAPIDKKIQLCNQIWVNKLIFNWTLWQQLISEIAKLSFNGNDIRIPD